MKYKLPNLAGSPSANNLTDEANQYQIIYNNIDRTTSGVGTYTSTSSDEVYSTDDYPDDDEVYNKGQEGICNLLAKYVLANYMITEDDINNKVEQSDFDEHKADLEYQIPVIVGTQIQLEKQSDTKRLYFKLDADLNSEDGFTITTNEGITEKPLVDINDEPLITLDKGFVEVVENPVNFTHAPKGGKNQGAIIITPNTVNQAIPKGVHNGLGYVKGDANLIESNIKSGVNIFGKVGTLAFSGLTMVSGNITLTNYEAPSIPLTNYNLNVVAALASQADNENITSLDRTAIQIGTKKFTQGGTASEKYTVYSLSDTSFQYTCGVFSGKSQWFVWGIPK